MTKDKQVALYCRCGATWKGEGLLQKDVNLIEAQWRRVHSEPDCGRTDARTAARARRNAERKAERKTR